jgi:CheY-like chemotaxis protein
MSIRKILHIDDDEDDQEIFASALAIAGNTVQLTAVDNPRTALHQLLLKHLDPDVIFLDLNIPEMNGQQFLVEMMKHEHLKAIPVIVLSTSSHAPTMEMVKELGAKDFITKPDLFDDLVLILKKILNKPA